MLRIRREQLTRLGGVSFESYVNSLVTQLMSEPYAAARQWRLPTGHSRNDLEKLVRQAITDARTLGFECEGDITPFVAMEIVLDDDFKESGEYSWISAILHATDLNAEERMDAIYELLPERERLLCFETSQSV